MVQGQQRMFYRNERTQSIADPRRDRRLHRRRTSCKIEQGRFFTENEVRHGRNVVVIGQVPCQAFFANSDPLGKVVRIGTIEYTVVGVAAPRPSIGGLATSQDALAVIPHTALPRRSARVARRQPARGPLGHRSSRCPHDGVPREDAMRDVETT